MQALAAWLVARPQNAIMGLVVTLLLPVPGMIGLISSMIVVLLVMLHGSKRAAIEVAIAGLILTAVALLLGFPVAQLMELMALFWLPALLLSVLLEKSRSLALTMQVSVILAAAALVVFYVAVPDPAAFWQPRVAEAVELMRASGFDLRTEQIDLEYWTVSAILMVWTLGTTGFLLGYGLYRKLPMETVDYGRFCDFSFGRVIGLAVALVSLLAWAADMDWLQNVAFVVFWIQGLAIVHFMHAQKLIPKGALIAVYIMVPLLQILTVTVLAIFGYMDVWFDFRRRLKKT